MSEMCKGCLLKGTPACLTCWRNSEVQNDCNQIRQMELCKFKKIYLRKNIHKHRQVDTVLYNA